mgnify:CR=1 FL=1
MTKWKSLSNDLKICVRIYQERLAGRETWASRLTELLKDDMTRTDVSMCEDKLMDLGILDKQYVKVEGKWTYCYKIESEAKSFIEGIVKHLGA